MSTSNGAFAGGDAEDTVHTATPSGPLTASFTSSAGFAPRATNDFADGQRRDGRMGGRSHERAQPSAASSGHSRSSVNSIRQSKHWNNGHTQTSAGRFGAGPSWSAGGSDATNSAGRFVCGESGQLASERRGVGATADVEMVACDSGVGRPADSHCSKERELASQSNRGVLASPFELDSGTNMDSASVGECPDIGVLQDQSPPHPHTRPVLPAQQAMCFGGQSVPGLPVPSTTYAAAPAGISASNSTASVATKAIWRRREQQEPASTEGSLRALLNKLAPSSDSFGSLANQVAGHFLEDEAPNELARQLVDRAQHEPVYASTYAKLCSVLVRVRSGFMFYKQLMLRCRSAFDLGVHTLIAEPMETCEEETALAISGCAGPDDQDQALTTTTAATAGQERRFRTSSQSYHESSSHNIWPTDTGSSGGSVATSASSGYPSGLDVQRHRLKALVVFLCQLFTENLLSFDRLYEDYLKLLEVHLPADDVAVECICSALTCAGQAMEEIRQQWVAATVHQLQAAVRVTQGHQQKQMRMIFMVQDLVELHQRHWQPREMLASVSGPRLPRDQAEP